MRMNPIAFQEPYKSRQSQLNGELASASCSALGYRVLGKLSSHFSTLSNTGSHAADWVAGPFLMPCWTGGEKAW